MRENPKTTWRRLTTLWNWRKPWPDKVGSATRTFGSAWPADDSLKLLDQCLLPSFDLPFRRSYIEEVCSVDLREFRLSS
jgi:hypothetical protein